LDVLTWMQLLWRFGWYPVLWAQEIYCQYDVYLRIAVWWVVSLQDTDNLHILCWNQMIIPGSWMLTRSSFIGPWLVLLNGWSLLVDSILLCSILWHCLDFVLPQGKDINLV